MIPSTNTKLLVTEDWKKIYQSFRNADFKSYDFDTLKRTMINYLQENYPEDFNDYIDSSEYIALIDVIAYLGQNLSFRIDLNARENFLETAQRRDSILRLAQLVSYVPTRNIPASGFLKVTAIATTDSVIDASGVNLANTTVVWNDSVNSNWYQQFISIINSAMLGSSVYGKPYDSKTIEGILTDQYRINSANTDLPIYEFSKNINGTSMNFEIVPSTISGETYVYEEAPLPSNTFSLIFKNDNGGSGSANTGFFTQFRQGSLSVSSFNISAPVPNEIVGVNTANINDTDVWLWQLDASGNYSNLWTKVPTTVGNTNIIYNSLNQSQRNIYSVTSRDNDQIDLNFADGSFGNLPKGQFQLFYRQSNGLTYVIKPEQMSGVVIDIPYYNKSNQLRTLTLTMGLQYTVNNSAGPESNSSIQTKAPQNYYIQDRMVTAEDYNIAPLTRTSDVLKVKSINRVSSGISKYFDLSDVSGKYSSTNIFATDGILYRKDNEQNFEFSFASRNEVYAAVKQQLEPIVAGPSMRSFYLSQYSNPDLTSLGLSWVQVNKIAGQSRGYFTDGTINPTVGSFANNNLQYIVSGTLIKFVAPSGKFFSSTGKLVSAQSSTTVNYIWTEVIQVIGDGSNTGIGALDDGTGPIILSNVIDSAAIPAQVIPSFKDIFSYTLETDIVNLCLTQKNFGLSIDSVTRSWTIISSTNLNLTSQFSLNNQGDTSNLGLDASWLISFTWSGYNYKVRYRLSDYIFESENQTAFYVDSNNVNYDFATNKLIKDQIDVLGINPATSPMTAANTSTFGSLGKDYKWQIDNSVVEVDGYIDPKKIKVSFYDQGTAGGIVDPDSFNNIVDPLSTSTVTGYFNKFVYFQTSTDGQSYNLVSSDLFTAYPTPADVNLNGTNTPSDGDLYYFYDPSYNVIKSYSVALQNTADPWVYQPSYFAYLGRSGLKFQYTHNAGQEYRIDPSKSNLIDVYMLTAAYDSEYRSWLSAGTGSEPLPPTSQSLSQNYSASLEPIKTVSDEIIYQSVKYKVLFGSQADINLQATFKAVRNETRTTSDNDIKTRILSAINDFFSLENWEFGQSFYFSELSTYVMNLMTPDITNFIIVPKSSSNNFGSLYEISCQSNEIFISGAIVTDIEVIDAITASQLHSTSIVTTSGS
jgi:hypothetical protein